jgi:DNA invertase Pin-like site-specific DNA recombinase
MFSRSRRLEMASHLVSVISNQIVPARNASHDTRAEAPGLVLGYMRFSTLEQAKNSFSLQRQQEKLQAYAQENGLVISKIFSDEAVTGAKADRPALRNLLRHAAPHPGTLVLMERPSRQARENKAFQEINQALEDVGAYVLFVNLGDVDSDTVAKESVNSSIEYHNLIEIMRDGRVEAIKLGVWMGIVPYGYRKTADKTLEIHAGEAEVVREMVKAYIAKASPEQIARSLNAKKVPTPAGKRSGQGKWTKSKVLAVLRRDILDGRVVQHVPIFPWERGVAGGGRTAQRRRIELRMEHLRVVSHEDWLACQSSGRVVAKGERLGPYLLTGKIRCRHCGNNLETKRYRGRTFLRCTHRSTEVACPEIRFDLPTIERIALHALGNAVDRDADTAFSAHLRTLVAHDVEQMRSDDIQRREQIRRLEERLHAAAARVVEDGEFYEFYRSTLEQQAQDLKSLRKQMAAAPDIDVVVESLEEKTVLLAEALSAVADAVPFRPYDADGRELLNTLREGIERVELIEALAGRFAVVVHLSGAPWNLTSSALPPQIFENKIVTDSLGRSDQAKEQILAASRTGKFLPSTEDLARLGELPQGRNRFPTGFAKVVEIVAMAVVIGVTAERVMSLLEVSGNRKDHIKSYWRSIEGKELRQLLADRWSVELDETKCRLRRSSIPTLRERLAKDGNLALLYPLADPASSESVIPDTDFHSLVEQGIAMPKGQLKGSWKTSDRRYLDGFFWLLRNNARGMELPKTCGSRTRLGILIRDLTAAGTWDKIVKSLLRSRGIAFDESITVLSPVDKDMIRRSRPRTKERKPATFHPDVVRGGRKAPRDIRQRMLDEFNERRSAS